MILMQSCEFDVYRFESVSRKNCQHLCLLSQYTYAHIHACLYVHACTHTYITKLKAVSMLLSEQHQGRLHITICLSLAMAIKEQDQKSKIWCTHQYLPVIIINRRSVNKQARWKLKMWFIFTGFELNVGVQLESKAWQRLGRHWHGPGAKCILCEGQVSSHER